MTVTRGDERSLWFAWKRAHDVVRLAVIEEVTAATGLSEPDIAVLLRLDEAGGTLRQNRLGAALGWDRSRLSHQLTRMESRDMVSRRSVDGGVEVEMTKPGRDAIDAATPIHADAVRRHLLEPLGAGAIADFHAALGRLARD